MSASSKPRPKRSLMKSGTKWAFSAEATIHGSVVAEGVDYQSVMNQRKDYQKAQHYSGRKWQALSKEAVENFPIYADLPLATFKSGAEVEILWVEADASRYPDDPQNGLLVGVKTKAENVTIHRMGGASKFNYYQTVPGGTIEGDDAILALPFKEFAPHVEETNPVEHFIYVIRDSATGLFYKSTNYAYFNFQYSSEHKAWSNLRDRLHHTPYNTPAERAAAYAEFDKEHPYPKNNVGKFVAVAGQDPFEMVEKVTQAKKHTDMGKVKTTILNFTAYGAGLDKSEDTPYWFDAGTDRDARPYPFPPTFEAVKMEKFTKEIVEVIDLQQWYSVTLALRSITARYGGSVRALYKKLAEKEERDAFPYIISFRKPVTAYATKYDDSRVREQLTKEDVAEIERNIAKLGLDGLKKVKEKTSISYACPEISDAVCLKMAVKMESVVLDVQNMQEMTGV